MRQHSFPFSFSLFFLLFSFEPTTGCKGVNTTFTHQEICWKIFENKWRQKSFLHCTKATWNDYQFLLDVFVDQIIINRNPPRSLVSIVWNIFWWINWCEYHQFWWNQIISAVPQSSVMKGIVDHVNLKTFCYRYAAFVDETAMDFSQRSFLFISIRFSFVICCNTHSSSFEAFTLS